MPELIRTEPELEAFLRRVGAAPFLAVDTETTGLDPSSDRVLLLQVGTAQEQALIDAQVLGARAGRHIFRPDRLVVMHHAKFDLKMLAGLCGLEALSEALVADTMLGEQLLSAGRRGEIGTPGLGLDVLAERYAGMRLDKSVRAGFFQAGSVDHLGEVELRYAMRDVEATAKVFSEQLPRLAQLGLLRVAAIEGAACLGFAEMERRGMPIDSEAWRALVKQAEERRESARLELDRELEPILGGDLFGHAVINYDSDPEVLEAMKRLGLELESTQREALLATGHPAAEAMVAYREQQKIVSAYGERFLEHVNPRTGRLHPTFKAIGATTGRASCREPNLQNIPSGAEFRACFRPGPGRKLLTADYSGAELRILAEVSQDPVFIRTFLEGGDLHAIVAAEMFRKPVSKTENPELRARAKAINFGLAYGMGAQGLAQRIGASVREAEALLERYFHAFPSIRGYLESSSREALGRGYAETLSGRRFWFHDMARQGADEASRLRVAKNMPIQGTNADMTKLAMARIGRALVKEGLDAFLVNMIHDEIVVEAASSDAERAFQLLVREMVSAGAEFVRCVPVEVEAKIGDHWEK